nr:SLC13 family permease [Hydrogenispora ethanolica]
MVRAGLLLGLVLIVFSLGKSPVFRVDRAGAAIIAATLMVGLGVLDFAGAIRAIDFRTLLILFFMMIVIANLKVAGFFDLIGSVLLRRVATRRQLLLAVIFISGGLSAVCINDIVCLLFTPIVLLVCAKARCNPLPHLLGVAIASNIGSAATFLGNPQNILIASLSGVPFLTYFRTALPVALAGLACAYWVIARLYRRELQGPLPALEQDRVGCHRYLAFKSLIVLALVIAGYIAGQDLALTSSLGAAFLLITRRVKPNKIYASIDFNLLIIFAGLFVLVGGLEQSGLARLLVREAARWVDLQNRAVFALLTVALSNLVSNVPAVLLLKFFLPETGAAAWWQALALFSTFAGNLTITGSIANLIVVEIAKRHNVRIGFADYLKAGLPVTLITSLLGLVFFHWLS